MPKLLRTLRECCCEQHKCCTLQFSILSCRPWDVSWLYLISPLLADQAAHHAAATAHVIRLWALCRFYSTHILFGRSMAPLPGSISMEASGRLMNFHDWIIP